MRRNPRVTGVKMLLDVEDILELLRGVPVPFWILFSVIFLGAGVGPVGAVHDFTAYRMQHFDLHGLHYGSRSAVINMEVRGESSLTLNRKCVVVRWGDLTLERFLDLIQRGAGGIVILIPRQWEERSVLQSWLELERDMLSSEVPVPVYLAWEDDTLLEIHRQVTRLADGEKTSSVATLLATTVTDYGYQMVSEVTKEPQVIKDPQIVTIMGKLPGQGIEQQLPSLAVVAHYDSFGLAPSLSHGVDSNGSGVAALLELVRLFSRLYGNPKQKPKYNLVFVLSGGGKLNYFGTKAFLDEQVDDSESSIFSDVDYTLCLDSLASRDHAPRLFLHVSKPPKEGMKAFELIEALNQTARLANVTVTLVHKKIRLSEDLLAWEHERFSIKRLPAATLSQFQSHKDLRRTSMFMNSSEVDVNVLAGNVKVIAEAIARHIYGLYTEDDKVEVEVLSGSHSVRSDYLSAWLEVLSRHPRSPQLLTREHPVVTGLVQTLSRYLHDVTVFMHKPEKSDPDFVVYDVPMTTMQSYRVKPAIFDLFLAILVAAYVFLWYLGISNFHRVAAYIRSLPVLVKVKTD